MKTVTTYLSFDGDCRRAVLFYQQCLGADVQLSPYPDANGQPSSDPAAKIMHAQLARGGAPILMASDTPQAGSLQPGNNFSVPSTAIRWMRPSACSQPLAVTVKRECHLRTHRGGHGSACSPTNSASSG